MPVTAAGVSCTTPATEAPAGAAVGGGGSKAWRSSSSSSAITATMHIGLLAAGHQLFGVDAQARAGTGDTLGDRLQRAAVGCGPTHNSGEQYSGFVQAVKQLVVTVKQGGKHNREGGWQGRVIVTGATSCCAAGDVPFSTELSSRPTALSSIAALPLFCCVWLSVCPTCHTTTTPRPHLHTQNSFPALSCEFATLDVSDALGTKRMNLTKTLRKTPIDLNLDHHGAAYEDNHKVQPKYDDEDMWVSNCYSNVVTFCSDARVRLEIDVVLGARKEVTAAHHFVLSHLVTPFAPTSSHTWFVLFSHSFHPCHSLPSTTNHAVGPHRLESTDRPQHLCNNPQPLSHCYRQLLRPLVSLVPTVGAGVGGGNKGSARKVPGSNGRPHSVCQGALVCVHAEGRVCLFVCVWVWLCGCGGGGCRRLVSFCQLGRRVVEV